MDKSKKLIVGALLLGGLWWFLNKKNDDEPTAPAEPDSTQPAGNTITPPAANSAAQAPQRVAENKAPTIQYGNPYPEMDLLNKKVYSAVEELNLNLLKVKTILEPNLKPRLTVTSFDYYIPVNQYVPTNEKYHFEGYGKELGVAIQRREVSTGKVDYLVKLNNGYLAYVPNTSIMAKLNS